MENIGELLKRARQNRQKRQAVAAMHVQRDTPRPRYQSSHGEYTALMRSHDRVRTRHIAGKGGAGGA